MLCKECTNQCMKPSHYTCSGKKEPDFLTDKQRKDRDRAFERGETNWKFPFEPWVIRGWRKFSAENGISERAEKVHENIINGPERMRQLLKKKKNK